MSMQQVKCSCCGAPLNVNFYENPIKCLYCGSIMVKDNELPRQDFDDFISNFDDSVITELNKKYFFIDFNTDVFFKKLKKSVNVPVVETDLTCLALPGYAGAHFEDILINLLNNSNGELEKAENGIVCLKNLNELYKENSLSFSNHLKICFYSCLKTKNYDVAYNDENIIFDTSNLKFVFYSELTKEITDDLCKSNPVKIKKK